MCVKWIAHNLHWAIWTTTLLNSISLSMRPSPACHPRITLEADQALRLTSFKSRGLCSTGAVVRGAWLRTRSVTFGESIGFVTGAVVGGAGWRTRSVAFGENWGIGV